MNAATTVTQKQLSEFLLNVALVRPVFIWGPPGIGKSALVQQFAAQVGLPCVSLLGSQLAPEDIIIGVPQIENGVVLDTSGSMDRHLLAKALGAIASYSLSRDVPAVRVVFFDATTYDQGYMPPEDIAGRVKVRGRGGAILQPGIDLLEKAKDFPDAGPILIITDGYCDNLTIKREHAFLLPAGHSLPFVPRGKTFRIS